MEKINKHKITITAHSAHFIIVSKSKTSLNNDDDDDHLQLRCILKLCPAKPLFLCKEYFEVENFPLAKTVRFGQRHDSTFTGMNKFNAITLNFYVSVVI